MEETNKYICDVKNYVKAEKHCRATFVDGSWMINGSQILFADENDCVLFKLAFVDTAMTDTERYQAINIKLNKIMTLIQINNIFGDPPDEET
jgi:hypothetical protein